MSPRSSSCRHSGRSSRRERMRFTYEALPGRIVFGAGRRAEIGAEVERLGAHARVPHLRRSGQGDRRRARRLARRARRRPLGRGRATRPGRARRSRPRRGGRRRCRPGRDGRRGLVDRAGQGDRADDRAADRRRADHLRGQRADHDLRPHRRPAQADRPRPRRAPEGRDLRPRAHARPAARRHRTERVQRPRPLGRGAVGEGGQPGDDRAVAGGCPGDRRLAAAGDGGTGRPRSAVAAAVRRLPVRRRAGHHVGRAAPQDHPRARRHVQPRPRRRPLGRAAARRRVQRAGPAGRDGAPRRSARHARRGSGGEPVGPGDGVERPDLAGCARLGARPAPRGGGAGCGRDHRQPAAVSTKPRCSACWSAAFDGVRPTTDARG